MKATILATSFRDKARSILETVDSTQITNCTVLKKPLNS